MTKFSRGSNITEMWFVFYFLGGFMIATAFHIPKDTSEGLIFCCDDENQDTESGELTLLGPEPLFGPTTTRNDWLKQRYAVELSFNPEDVDPEDYRGIHRSIQIRRRRVSERECLKYTQPNQGCYWQYRDGERYVSCTHFVASGLPTVEGEFPYMAAVGFASGNQTIWTCGGTLISKKFVLTAAHCAFSRETGLPPSVVRLGAHNIVKDHHALQIRVVNAVIHPNYTLTLKYHDIALLELARPVKLSKLLKPACLWQHAEVQGRPTVVGWGRTGYLRDKSEELLKGTLDVIPEQACQRMMRPTKKFPRLIDSQICALDRGGRRGRFVDTCQGDSGGPLLIMDSRDAGYDIPYIIGITSFGKTCSDGYPGIYTRISSYIPWIESHVWPDPEFRSSDYSWP